MEHFRLNVLSEVDVDHIIFSAGGARAVADDSVEVCLNADYLLDNAVIELKLIEEEGLEKQTRRQKLAELFLTSQPARPVVVLDPELLNESGRRKYYNIVEGPIKTQVKKAAKQLDSTARQQDKPFLRILWAINNSYTALTHEEFVERVVKCATNDTARIDFVVVAGCYYYSDTFDYCLLAPIDCVRIRGGPAFPSFEKIRQQWNKLVGDKLVATIRGKERINKLKSPVLDLVFDIDGIKFVKPSPPIGGVSSFFPHGRPRANSTDMSQVPPVARTFPSLSKVQWEQFKSAMPGERLLRRDYSAWSTIAGKYDRRPIMPHQLLIPVELKFQEFQEWLKDAEVDRDFSGINQFACHIFEQILRETIDSAKPLSDSGVLHPRFIVLKVEEIGQDQALDICSIYNRSISPGFEREELLVENLNICLEHGIALAAAYAFRHGLSAVRFEIDKTYSWF